MKKKIQCDFCDQKIKGEPYTVEYYREDGTTLEDFRSKACDDCAKVLKVMAESFQNVIEKQGDLS